MSGICGIQFSSHSRPGRTTDIVTMVRSLAAVAPLKDPIVNLPFGVLGAQAFPGRVAGVTRLWSNGHVFGIALHGTILNAAQLGADGNGAGGLLSGLLRLYREEGPDFALKVRGEFAIAIWDGAQECLRIFTDRFRVHPIFYYHDSHKLVFGSRMKAILACPLPLKLTVDPEAIVNVVSSSFVPTPATIYREIRKLPPGHFLTYRHGVAKVEPYWDVDFTEPDPRSEARLAEELREIFSEAISLRLECDRGRRRLGTFLSGGVDSSTVTGVLTQLTRPGVPCFSIGFDEQQFNEIRYARIAAEAFAAEHHEYFVTPKDVLEATPVLLDSFDEPYANASAVPTYFCARLARAHGVDVLYAGDGGDELFAGNERYASQRLFDYYQEIPQPLRDYVIEPVVNTLASTIKLPLFVRGQKYIRRANVPYPDRLSTYAFFNVVKLGDFFEDDFLQACGKNCDPYAAVRSCYFQAPAQCVLDRQLYVDLKLTISDNDLFKVTRMTEAAGVAVRYPFLDHRVTEFAARVPARLKMRGRRLRTFFKNAYSELLPVEVRAKRKHGFGLPIPIWLRTDRRLNEMMHDLVLGETAVQRGYFRRRALEDLVERHRSDTTSFYGTILWNLIILELWQRQRSEAAAFRGNAGLGPIGCGR